MLGLRYFACPRCETVFAFPASESRCPSCDGGTLEEITNRLHDDAYFAPATEPGAR
ncbi:hypothetical protein [Haloarchaeobius sp. TZWSO28]|uniref:hypothetical protein n=1 Tax=Haloarchaeobius sp. TZWSO28 TaxID=3446119 RepID=UPI003EB69684